MSFKTILRMVLLLGFMQITFAQDDLIGHWTFDDPGNPLTALVGNDLILQGTGLWIVDGSDANDGAVRIGQGSNFIVDHGLYLKNANSKINEYSIVMDICLPELPSADHWYSLYQTEFENTTDGDWFFDTAARMGVSDIGYTDYIYDKVGEWYRIAISVNNGDLYNYYSDGVNRLVGDPGSKNGRFSFGEFFLLFADQNGEDNEIDVADVKLYSRALTDAEIASLGGYSHTSASAELFPYLQTPSANSMYINWNCTTSEESRVEYGTDASLANSELGSVEIIDGETTWWHSVKLTGLTPSTTYFYKVISGANESAVYNFKTQAAAGESDGHFRFVVLGDNQRVELGKFGEIADSIKSTIQKEYGSDMSENINLMINVGDIVNNGTILGQFESQYFNQYKGLSATIPTMVSIGNHEREAEYYYQFMKYEDFAGPEGEPYYTYNIGRICFVALNTNDTDEMDVDYSISYRNDTQIDWLNSVLTAAQNDENIDWIVTYFHHPGVSELCPTGTRDYVQDRIIPTVSQYSKAELALYGHTHDYERGALADGNLRLMLVGGGGAVLERWGDYSHVDYSEIQKTYDHYCYSIIDIDIVNESYEVKTYSLGHEDKVLPNVVIDSFSRDKNAVAPPKPALVFPPSGTVLNPDFYAEAENLTLDYDIMSSQIQITENEGDYSDLIYETVQHFEDIFGDSGPSDYNPVDVNAGIELNKFLVTSSGMKSGDTYWWRVRYRDKNLNWTEWSDAWSFTYDRKADPISKSGLNFQDSDIQRNSYTANETRLYENYPNPFNATTVINFSLKEPGHVSLKIYAVDGKLVKTLVDRAMPSGLLSVRWDGKNNYNNLVPSGNYFYQIETKGYIKTYKLLMMK